MPANRKPGLNKSVLGRSLVNSKAPSTGGGHRNSYNRPLSNNLIHVTSDSMNEGNQTSLKSVVEEATQLDTFIATTLSSQKDFYSLRGTMRFLPGPRAINNEFKIEHSTSDDHPIIPIPRRPQVYKRQNDISYELDYDDSNLNETFREQNSYCNRKNDQQNEEDCCNKAKSTKNLNLTGAHFCGCKSEESQVHHLASSFVSNQDDHSSKAEQTKLDENLTETQKNNQAWMPPQKSQISRPELEKQELDSFLRWRRDLAHLEEVDGYTLTPFEKNIEVWKQLWRVLERSHIILELLDARNPMLFHSPDLINYIKEIDPEKQILIVINKSDFLPTSLRKSWLEYFRSLGLEVVFFSAITELFYQGALGPQHYTNLAYDTEEEFLESLKNSESDLGENETRILDSNSLLRLLEAKRDESIECLNQKQNDDCDRTIEGENPTSNQLANYTVGLVGYPNVGKSSMINSLFGSKKVSMSRQPGKTKHFQTLPMPSVNLTLCDCPGLVFPSIVVGKNHLLINGIISLNHFRGDFAQGIQLICNQIPQQLFERYKIIPANVLQKSGTDAHMIYMNARTFLSELALARKFYSGGKGGQLDLFRAANLVIQDYITGKLLYNFHPFNSNQQYTQTIQYFRDIESTLEINTKNNTSTYKSEAEVKKLLFEEEEKPQTMTKKMMRKNQKKMLKGKSIQVDNFGSYSIQT